MIEPRSFTFHPPGQVGPIAAAVGAGHVLQLSRDQLTHAVGIAASSCGSLMGNAGSMTKALHCGNAAADGLMAALLAKRDFTANDAILDDPYGYAPNIVARLEPATLCATDRPLRIEQPGYAIKLFPCQYGTHFGITAALEAVARIPDALRITDVELRVPDMAYVDRPLPRTGLEGKFSFQYTVAAALLDRRVVIETFADDRLCAADMQRLLPLVRVVAQHGQTAHFENMEVTLLVTLDDGSRVQSTCTAPRGYLNKGVPVLDSEIEAKARNCLARQLDERQTQFVIDSVGSVELQDANGLLGLFEALRCSRSGA